MRFGRLLISIGIAGVAAGLMTPVRAPAAVSIAVACASLAVLAHDRRHRRVAVAAMVLACAAAHGATARTRALSPPLVRWFAGMAPESGRASDSVWIEGAIVGDAEPVEDGARLLIAVRTVRSASGVQRTRGRVQAHVGGAYAADRLTEWVDGRWIRAPVTLREPPIVRNPGSPSPTLQTIRRSFDLSGTIKSASLVEAGRGRWWTEAAAALRAHVRGALATYIGARDPQASAIVAAILIGDRSALDPAVERRLQIAGTYHVVAISGGNIALLLVLGLGGLRLISRSARGTGLGAIALVLTYGWIVGGDPSVVRAVAAACLYLALGLAGQTASPIDILGTVAAGMVAWNPRSAVDVGAWLSFLATLGIILCAGRVFAWLHVLPAVWLRRRGGAPPVWLARGWTTMAALLSATAAAEWSLLPISARVFGRVGVAGLGLNFIAIPAMAAVQVAGLLTCAFARVWPWGAAVAAAGATAASHALVASAALVELAPWTTWRVPPGSIAWTVMFYAALLGLLVANTTLWRRRALAIGMVASAAMIATAPEAAWSRPRAPWLRLTVVDVGQGDALLLQFPGGEALAVDTGGVPGALDVGERIVTPAAWALGVRRLSWLAVSHDDWDHIGGAVSLAANLRPREMWESVPVTVNPAWRRWRAAARAVGAAWRSLQAGDRLEIGDVSLIARSPPPPDWERRRVRNDDSLVLDVRYGDVGLLLTGDISEDVERTLLSGVSLAPLRVLKVAHHGSRTSSSAAFIETFGPQIALVSAGRGNLFGHPSREVVDRLQRAGARLFRTDEDGAIIVETDGHVVHVRTIAGRAWTLRLTRLPA